MLRDIPATRDRSICGLRRWSVLQFLTGIRGGARIAIAVGLLACFGLEGLWASTRVVAHGLTVHPNRATVAVNQAQRFRVTDDQGRTVAVNWNVSGLGCSGLACGTVDAQGIYRIQKETLDTDYIARWCAAKGLTDLWTRIQEAKD